MGVVSKVGTVSAIVGLSLLAWAMVNGSWSIHGLPGGVLLFIGALQVGITRALSKGLGDLKAPTMGEVNRSMTLATEMMARSRLRDTLRGSGVKAKMTLLEATPTGAQWQHAPVYDLRMRHQTGSADPLVEVRLREVVPVTCVPKLTPGSTWSGFVDPNDPQRAFVDW